MKRNIAVMLPNWIGDVVMATPLLKAIRDTTADTRILGVMRPYVARVLEGSGLLDGELLFDPRSAQRALQTRAVIRQLWAHRLDAMLLLTNSLRAGWIAWRSGARRRVGYVRNGRGPLLTDKLYAPRGNGAYTPIPAIDYYLAIGQTLGISAATRQMQLGTTARDEELADQLWEAFRLNGHQRVVLFNTGGAKGAAKDWPSEYFVRLAKLVLQHHDASIVILCGPNEREKALHIQQSVRSPRLHSLADPRVLDFVTAENGIGVAKAAVRRSDLMVTTDSGPRHFAHAFDIPVVTLYGPNDPAWTVPYHERSLHLYRKLPCSFCAQRVCPLGTHQCMQELTVDRVFQAVSRLFSEYVQRAA